MFNKLCNVRLAGLRAAVPTGVINIDDEAEFYGGSLKKVARMRSTLGMDKRRICDPDTTASDLCAFAARDLFRAFPDMPEKIDALIFVSQTPDWKQPATACELQNRLGLPRTCAAMDVNQGCSGYIYGMWVGSAMVASGAARNVLLLVGDACPGGRDVRNRIMAPVFGDGGSATLLTYDEKAPPLYFDLGTDGSGFETIIAPAGQQRIPFVNGMENNTDFFEEIVDSMGNVWTLRDTYMDGGAVFNFTMDVVPGHLKAFMADAGTTPEAIDWLILHQANGQIVRIVADKAGFPDNKAPADSFSHYGNLATASVPAALCDAFGEIKSPGRVLMCGYGIGLSWGSCLCDLENLDCAPVLEYKPEPNRPDRQMRIERWKKILKGEISRHE